MCNDMVAYNYEFHFVLFGFESQCELCGQKSPEWHMSLLDCSYLITHSDDFNNDLIDLLCAFTQTVF